MQSGTPSRSGWLHVASVLANRNTPQPHAKPKAGRNPLNRGTDGATPEEQSGVRRELDRGGPANRVRHPDPTTPEGRPDFVYMDAGLPRLPRLGGYDGDRVQPCGHDADLPTGEGADEHPGRDLADHARPDHLPRSRHPELTVSTEQESSEL